MNKPVKTINTTGWMNEKGISGGCSDGDPAVSSGTSIFDPVLCEVAYKWFCPPGGRILDPFAGGSVRGLVASVLGYQYDGVELRPEQVEANRAQVHLGGDLTPSWHIGDSRNIGEIAPPGPYDFVFSCPPYADLEIYSDNPADISTLSYKDFRQAYAEIINKTAKLLADDAFFCFVVGDARGKDGNYYGLPEDTHAACVSAGLAKYNEAILVTAAGSLPIRAGGQFRASRKIGKTHQNILVYVKGSGKRATQKVTA